MSGNFQDIAAVSAKLDVEVPELAAVKEGLAKLPMWIDSLRQATVKHLTDKIVAACRRYHAKKLELLQPSESVSGDEATKLVAEARGFYEALLASKAIMLKVPPLAAVFTESQSLLASAQQHERKSALQDALQPFLVTEGIALALPTQASVNTLAAFLNRDSVQNYPLDPESLEMMERATFFIAEIIAEFAGNEVSDDDEKCLVSEMPLLTKMHGLIGDSGCLSLRTWVVEVLQCVFPLHQALLEERKAEDAHEAATVEGSFPRAIHVQAVLSRCAEKCGQEMPEDPSGHGKKVLECCEAIVKDAKDWVKEIGEKLHAQAVQEMQRALAESTEIFGAIEDIKKRGCGNWAAKMKAGSTLLADIAAFAEKNLLTEATALKTNKTVKKNEQVLSSARARERFGSA